MFDYDELINKWDDNKRYDAANNFIYTCHRLDVWRSTDNQNIKNSYYEKEWMSQLHWYSSEFVDTLTKLGLTPNGSKSEIKDYFWSSLNVF